jgi:hypothetical protein
VKIAVTGGRTYTDEAMVRRALELFRDVTLLVGDAAGADALARAYGKSAGWDIEVFVAEWDVYGPSAGPLRNAEILKWEPDVLLAFPGGSGTANMIEQARRAGVLTFFVGKR